MVAPSLWAGDSHPQGPQHGWLSGMDLNHSVSLQSLAFSSTIPDAGFPMPPKISAWALPFVDGAHRSLVWPRNSESCPNVRPSDCAGIA